MSAPAVLPVKVAAPASAIGDPLPPVRLAVRALLLACPAYHQLDPTQRRNMAAAMVKVCHAAATLIREEALSDEEARTLQDAASPPVPDLPAHLEVQQAAAAAEPVAAGPQPEDALQTPRRVPLARAQTAGSDFSGVSASQVAGTTRAILNAVSFPRFVTELINGVFKAVLDSSVQQMNSYVDLLNNVAASVEGFADANMGPDSPRQWLVDKFPDSFEVAREEAEEGWEGEGPARPQYRLQLIEGAQMPSAEALKAGLGLGPEESLPSGDPERVLVPFARRQLAKTRQSMLSTMVMLGMQRIVVDSGRINAAMRFHIDTRSAAQADQGSSFDARFSSRAEGQFGIGAWGVKAEVSNTIGYVSTQRSQTTEEMNTDLELNSSVEINFRSDYLPLNRLAGPGQADAIRANSRNPDVELALAAEESRRERAKLAAASDDKRRAELSKALPPPPAAPPMSDPNKGLWPELGKQGKDDAAAKKGQGASDAAKGAKGSPANAKKPAAANTGSQPPAAAPATAGA